MRSIKGRIAVRRVGACNGCSLCCRTLVIPVPRPDAAKRSPIGVSFPLPLFPSRDLIHFYRARGLRVTANAVEVPLPPEASVELTNRGPRLVARMPHICPQLATDGRCRIHNSPEFPRACSSFPRHPEDILDVAQECSYQFVTDPEPLSAERD